MTQVGLCSALSRRQQMGSVGYLVMPESPPGMSRTHGCFPSNSPGFPIEQAVNGCKWVSTLRCAMIPHHRLSHPSPHKANPTTTTTTSIRARAAGLSGTVQHVVMPPRLRGIEKPLVDRRPRNVVCVLSMVTMNER